jgi:hypothetical protein
MHRCTWCKLWQFGIAEYCRCGILPTCPFASFAQVIKRVIMERDTYNMLKPESPYSWAVRLQDVGSLTGVCPWTFRRWGYGPRSSDKKKLILAGKLTEKAWNGHGCWWVFSTWQHLRQHDRCRTPHVSALTCFDTYTHAHMHTILII